jgi:hypothetical protein
LVRQHCQVFADEYYEALLLVNDDLSDILLLAAEISDVATALIILGNNYHYSVISSKKAGSEIYLDDCFIKALINEESKKVGFTFKPTNTTPVAYYATIKLTTSDGNIIGYLCLINCISKQVSLSEEKCLELIAHQITQRCEKALELKKSLHANQKANAFLHSVLNTNPDYQILLNNQLEIIVYNNCAAHFTRHFTGCELKKGANVLTYISSEFTDEFTSLCCKAFIGEKVHYEHYVNKKPYNNTWFCFTLSPIYNNSTKVIGIIVTGTNINKQKKQEKTIRHQSDSLSVIAQLQSHQVRQPVTSILGLISLIKEDNYIPQKEYLIGLEKAAHQLDEVIQTIVSQSRRV